tara:strand:- start:1043 stop:1216 length:174 start_codon:yes stop_codon:yes gene_type:complete
MRIHAAIARVKIQLDKIRDELNILDRQVRSLEKTAASLPQDSSNIDFSREKEDFIAP